MSQTWPTEKQLAKRTARHRAEIIAALGMPAENLTDPGERYAGTTGELLAALIERKPEEGKALAKRQAGEIFELVKP